MKVLVSWLSLCFILISLIFFPISCQGCVSTSGRRVSERMRSLKDRIVKPPPSTLTSSQLSQDYPSLLLIKIRGDGNCQFRALAQALYGDLSDGHKLVRNKIAHQIELLPHDDSFHLRLFSLLENGDYRRNGQVEQVLQSMKDSYQTPKHLADYYRKNGVYGDYNTLVEAAKLWNINIVVLDSGHNVKSVISPKNRDENSKFVILLHSHDHYDLIGYNNNQLNGKEHRKQHIQTIFDSKSVKLILNLDEKGIFSLNNKAS